MTNQQNCPDQVVVVVEVVVVVVIVVVVEVVVVVDNSSSGSRSCRRRNGMSLQATLNSVTNPSAIESQILFANIQ